MAGLGCSIATADLVVERLLSSEAKEEDMCQGYPRNPSGTVEASIGSSRAVLVGEVSVEEVVEATLEEVGFRTVLAVLSTWEAAGATRIQGSVRQGTTTSVMVLC